MKGEKERRQRTEAPVAGERLTVAGLAQLHLEWADGERDAGSFSPPESTW